MNLAEFVDLAPWVHRFRAPRWRTLDAAPWNRSMPHCNLRETDCEAIDALQLLFWKHKGGVTLELGGLDGDIMSETKLLSDVAGFKRIVIEETHITGEAPKPKPQWSASTAVCSSPGLMHYIGDGAVGGIVEFMPDTFLKMWYPSLLDTKMAAARRPERAGKQMDWGAVDFKAKQIAATEVVCTSLTAILDHVGISHIHFGILDTEGAELRS